MGDTKLYEKALKFEHISTATTTIIRGDNPAKLHFVNINTGDAGSTLQVHNGGSAGGAIVSNASSAGSGNLTFEGITLSGGLTIVTDGTADLTVIYE